MSHEWDARGFRAGWDLADPTSFNVNHTKLWLCGEDDLTWDFLNGFDHNVLVVTCKPEPCGRIVDRCHMQGKLTPLLFNIGHVAHRGLDSDYIIRICYENLLANREVILHCKAGKHRAATFCLVVLMHVTGCGPQEVAEHMRALRPAIRIPCHDFRQYVFDQQEKVSHGIWRIRGADLSTDLPELRGQAVSPAHSVIAAAATVHSWQPDGCPTGAPWNLAGDEMKDAIWNALPAWRQDEYRQLTTEELPHWWKLVTSQDRLPLHTGAPSGTIGEMQPALLRGDSPYASPDSTVTLPNGNIICLNNTVPYGAPGIMRHTDHLLDVHAHAFEIGDGSTLALQLTRTEPYTRLAHLRNAAATLDAMVYNLAMTMRIAQGLRNADDLEYRDPSTDHTRVNTDGHSLRNPFRNALATRAEEWHAVARHSVLAVGDGYINVQAGDPLRVRYIGVRGTSDDGWAYVVNEPPNGPAASGWLVADALEDLVATYGPNSLYPRYHPRPPPSFPHWTPRRPPLMRPTALRPRIYLMNASSPPAQIVGTRPPTFPLHPSPRLSPVTASPAIAQSLAPCAPAPDPVRPCRCTPLADALRPRRTWCSPTLPVLPVPFTTTIIIVASITLVAISAFAALCPLQLAAVGKP